MKTNLKLLKLQAQRHAESAAMLVNSRDVMNLIEDLERAKGALVFYAKNSPTIPLGSPGERMEFGCGCCAGTIDNEGQNDMDDSVIGLTARETLEGMKTE